MLNLAENGCFVMINIFLPVDSGIGIRGLSLRWSSVDVEVNLCLVLVVTNFGVLLQTEITGVPVDHIIVLADELFRHFHIVDIGGGNFNRVNHACTGIHTDMSLHAEMPPVTLFGLVHFRVTLTAFVFRGSGRSDDSSVNDRAATPNEACFFKRFVQSGKQLFSNPLPSMMRRKWSSVVASGTWHSVKFIPINLRKA